MQRPIGFIVPKRQCTPRRFANFGSALPMRQLLECAGLLPLFRFFASFSVFGGENLLSQVRQFVGFRSTALLK
jgi:hypothetical protein